MNKYLKQIIIIELVLIALIILGVTVSSIKSKQENKREYEDQRVEIKDIEYDAVGNTKLEKHNTPSMNPSRLSNIEQNELVVNENINCSYCETDTEIENVKEYPLITLYANSNVNIRAAATLDSVVIGILNFNESILAYEYDATLMWTKVNYNGVDAFVYTQYLSLNQCTETPLYTVDGVMLDEVYQEYLYNLCNQFNIGYYFPYFLCQIYQESRFNHWCAPGSGLDYGFCQLRIWYHAEWCSQCGHPEFDVINNPFDNLYVGCWLMANRLLTYNGDIPSALSMYFNSGNDAANAKYVADVSQWYITLQRIR